MFKVTTNVNPFRFRMLHLSIEDILMSENLIFFLLFDQLQVVPKYSVQSNNFPEFAGSYKTGKVEATLREEFCMKFLKSEAINHDLP